MRKIKIVTIVGARPQIIKAAAISRAIEKRYADKILEILVHTGQHYDENMSQIFFDELGIPTPSYNLNIGSGSHSKQTSMMLEAIGELLIKEKPDALLLYGDTNSTLAAAIASVKIHIPIIHVEGGLRSFNKLYPEEVNRIMTDHMSTMIFAPTIDGYNNLIKEGFKNNTTPPYTLNNPKIYHCGDIMYDNSLFFSTISHEKTSIIKDNNLIENNFILVTIHRDINTDNHVRLNAYFNAIYTISEKENIKFILPLHPRTSSILKKALNDDLYDKISSSELIKIVPPASFLEIIELEKNAKMVMTDSGGVQKEAFFFNKPCIIFLNETPWIELIECGSAILVDADETKILNAFEYFKSTPELKFPSYYGDGTSAEFICEEIIKNFDKTIN